MNSKYKMIKIIIMLLISVSIIIFVYNDYSLYKTPILKVQKIENENSNKESYNQKITGIIKNGKYKNKKITVNNNASYSGVYDDKIHKNSELFIKFSDDNNTHTIIGIKRDKYLAILGVIFINLLLLVTGTRGFKIILSLISNLIISIICIIICIKNYQTINLLLLFIPISFIFISLSLFITNGKSKKTLSAIISSIVSLIISFLLYFILINIFGKNIPIWTLDYMEVVFDYKNYFYISILLCGLGAVMDIAITMSSSINELIIKNKRISKKALIKSGREISKDIIGTMINVVLYTCYTTIIPIVLLAFKNKVAIATAIKIYADVEFIIVLCNCITIAITIPISLLISIYIMNPEKSKEETL